MVYCFGNERPDNSSTYPSSCGALHGSGISPTSTCIDLSGLQRRKFKASLLRSSSSRRRPYTPPLTIRSPVPYYTDDKESNVTCEQVGLAHQVLYRRKLMSPSRRRAPTCPPGFVADEINTLKSFLRRSMGMLCTLAPARFATPHDLLSKSRTVTVSKSSAGEQRLEQISFVSAAQIWRGKNK
jgi:hypothetical protein